MIGCVVYYLFVDILIGVDICIFGQDVGFDVIVVVEQMLFYIEVYLVNGGCFNQIMCYMFGLFIGCFGVWFWCWYLLENVYKDGVGIQIILDVLVFLCEMVQ